MSEKPSINLEIRRVVCAVHGEPFREQWPKGYIPFLLFAIDAVMAQEGFVAYAGREVEKIDAMLDVKPLCCRLSPEKRLQAFVQCELGKIGTCAFCRKVAKGTPYHFMSESGPQRASHVCFSCVANREGQPR